MNTIIDPHSTNLKSRLINQVVKRLPFLTAGEVYTLAAILGEQFWEEDDEDSHNALGRVFSGLVNAGELPFESNGWTSNRHNEYRYKPIT
ncbi:MAG: hypothetical protein H6992_13835 [Pseudomonadales bacterium]|nr:hypothetical protein [Pseudomonadales bacterium]